MTPSEWMPDGRSIRELTTVREVFEAADVLDQVWSGERGSMPANVLRALEHSGNYVAGLFSGDRMVGASVAFFAPPAARSMHSHVTGVLPGFRGRGVGRMLKAHQREWALQRGVEHITWTFDPLVARNAHFNLTVLGARVTEYLPDHYGAMRDDVNRGDASDRLFADWAITASPRPVPADDEVRAVVAVPGDIEALRRSSPDEAADWRLRVREQLGGKLSAGLVVGGFDARRGYLLVEG